MSEQQQDKRPKISAEDFIAAVNNPSVTSMMDVARNLNLKPDTVKQRFSSFSKLGIKLRKLPFGNGTGMRSNSIKNNPERLAKLQALANQFQDSENNKNVAI